MDDFDLYRLFKTLHVISVVVLGGGIVLEGIVGALLPRVQTVQEARAYARLLFISENYLSLPAVVAIAVFGYLTADRLSISLDETWLLLGQVLFYAAVIIAVVFLRTAANKLYETARSAPDGPVTGELSLQLKSPQPAIFGTIASLLFVAIIYLMVAKPAW
jgi:uncharacterized membrane protein